MYIYVMYIHCWANTQFSNFLDPIGEIRQAPLALLSPWSGLVGTPGGGDVSPSPIMVKNIGKPGEHFPKPVQFPYQSHISW